MKTILTFGCWDLLHVGHVQFLQRAACLGTHLVVGVPSDDVVALDKGQPPIIPLRDRLAMVGALKFVYYTAHYTSLDFIPTLELVRPNLLIIGQDWGMEPRHRAAIQWCLEHDVHVIRFGRHTDESTSRIKERIVEEHKRRTSSGSVAADPRVTNPTLPPLTNL